MFMITGVLTSLKKAGHMAKYSMILRKHILYLNHIKVFQEKFAVYLLFVYCLKLIYDSKGANEI